MYPHAAPGRWFPGDTAVPGAPAEHPNPHFLLDGSMPRAHGHRVVLLLPSSPQKPADLKTPHYFSRGLGWAGGSGAPKLLSRDEPFPNAMDIGTAAAPRIQP